MKISDKKTALRISAKKLRKTLPMEEISSELVMKIRKCPQYANAKNVMLFYPTMDEVNLLPLLKDDKNFYFPRVDGENLQVCPYKQGDKLNKSRFNIFEPCSKPVEPKLLDLVIVPALMADKNGFRLGYGGGFYDRFLGNSCTTICPIPKKLYVDELPHDEFDIPVDIVIIS